MAAAGVAALAGLAGALAGALVTWLAARRGLPAASLLAERTRWRDTIRATTLELLGRPGGRAAARAWMVLALHTDPADPADLALVRLAKRIGGEVLPDEAAREELVERVALLLKHDWDRAKIEASLWPFGARRRATRLRPRASRYRELAIPEPAGDHRAAD